MTIQTLKQKPARFQHATLWRAEIKALLALGAPMGLTQLVQFSINTIDVLMIGRLSAEALAASSLGLVVYYVAFLIGLGPAMAITPMVSQTLGADPDNVQDARRSVRMGLWAVLMCYPLILALAFCAEPLLRAMGQPAELTTLAGPYVLALMPGWPFMLAVVVMRNFFAAIDRTRAPLIFIIATTIVNAGLNYVLIFGAFGAPRLELVGAGIASSLSHMAGFGLLLGYAYWDKAARRFELFVRVWRSDWERLREVIRLGWPISVTIGFEAMLFNAAVLIMGRIGVDETAAYQIGLNVSALAFMIPLGLSMAGATRVGLAQGAGDHAGVIRAAVVAAGVSVTVILLFALPVGFAPQLIAGLYLDLDDPANQAVIGLVALFLPVAAAFMVFDAVQVAAAQSLRGLKDVNMPMILCGVSYWLIGFPAAYFLALHTPIGAVGVWWGLLLSLVASSTLLSGRLYWFLRK